MRKLLNVGLMLLLLMAMAFPVAADNTAVIETKSFQSNVFTGSFETCTPLEVMSGINGVQPSLAICYSSLSIDELGNRQPGILGLGRRLDGANDRVVKVGPNHYSLIHNGIGYDLVWTETGFKTNPESYLKITYSSDTWSVIDTAGTVSQYGQSDVSRLKEAIPNGEEFINGETQAWYVNEVENINGIKMKMFYTKYNADDGHERSIIPASIEYNFDQNGDSKSKVVFVTSIVEDIKDDYKKTGHWDDRKIDSIENWFNGFPVSKYALDYIYSSVPAQANIVNGDFETGEFYPWSYWSDNYHEVKVEKSGYVGYGVLMTLNAYKGKVFIEQTVKIPENGGASMSYWVKIDPFELEDFDGLSVYVDVDSESDLVDFFHAENTDWIKREVNLEDYAGKTVTIRFETENTVGDDKASESGKVFIDEVVLVSGDTDKGYLLLNSIIQWGSDGTSFTGILPVENFIYNSENLLNKTFNRFGGSSEIEYESYTPHTEFTDVFSDQTRRRMIKVLTNDGLGSRTTQYDYKDNNGVSTDLYHLETGEFRGHGRVTINKSSGIKNILYFNQSDEAKGMLEKTEVWGNDGVKYDQVKNTIETDTKIISLPSEDQLVNFDFESGNILGWQVDCTGSCSADASDETANNHSVYSLKITAGVDESGIVNVNQTITLSQDTGMLSFFARSAAAPAGSGFGVFLKNESGEYQIIFGISSDEWTEYKTDVSQWQNQEVTFVLRAYQTLEDSPEIMLFIDDIKLLHKTDLVTNPFVSETRAISYQGENAKETRTTFSRDEFGNVIDTIEYGEYDFASNQDIGMDKRENSTEYINDKVKNILGVPKHSAVYGYNLNNEYVLQREGWQYYDNLPYGELSKGQMTRTEARKDSEKNISSEQGYDDFGNIIWTIDANKNINSATGHTTDTEYDASLYHIYPSKNCDALNFCSTIEYDQLMRPIAFTDINGQVTKQKSDEFGRVIALAMPGDSLEDPTMRTQYGDVANFAENKPAFIRTIAKDGTLNGLVKISLFDGFHNTIQEKTEGVNESEWLVTDSYICDDTCELNSRGKLDRTSVPYTAITDAPELLNRKNKEEVGIWTVFGYDSVGRQNLTTKPDGTSTETVFGLWMTEFYDALSHKMAEYTDGLGMKTKIENYLGSSPETYQLYATTSFKYNSGSGELVKLTDPAGNEQITDFNLLGWKNWMNDPDRGNWSYLYNNNGVVTSQTDAKDQVINFTLDLKDRVVMKDYPGQFDTIYVYDNCTNGKGRLCLVAGGDKNFKTQNKPSYDERGRTVNIQLTINNKSWNTSMSYDSMDRIVNTTYPDGEVVAQRQNGAGLLGSPDGVIPAVQSNLYENYPYLENVFYGQEKPIGYKYGNGRMTSLEYNDGPGKQDPNNGRSYTYQLVRILTDGGVQDLSYGHDDIGNVVKVIDGLNTTNSADYVLDDLSRLISANSGTYGKLEFAYNNIGNFISKEGLLYIYPASGSGSERPHAPISVGENKSFAYDRNGNMKNSMVFEKVSALKTELEDDVKDTNIEEVFVSEAEDESVESAGINAGRLFMYNPDNMVIKISNQKGILGLYTYLDTERVVKREYNTTTFYIGGIYEEKYWLNGTRKAVVKYYSVGDDAIAIRTNLTVGDGFNETLRFVHKDYLGSTSSTTGESGELKLRVAYKPYGEEIRIEGEKDEKKRTRDLFTGKEKDISTGLYCNSARCYNPVLGMFLSPDPIQGPNRYKYADNNPINKIDPSGNIVVLAAAVPYVMAALPTITLLTTGYLASNWEENIAAGFTGADVASLAIPLPIGGKAKIAKKLSENAAKKKLREELIKSRANEVVEERVVKNRVTDAIKHLKSEEAIIDSKARQTRMKKLLEQGLTEKEAFRKIASENFEGLHADKWETPLENIKDLPKEERNKILKQLLEIEWKE